MRRATRSAPGAASEDAHASAATARPAHFIARDPARATIPPPLSEKLSLKGGSCVGLSCEGGELGQVGALARERGPGLVRFLGGAQVVQEEREDHPIRESARRGARLRHLFEHRRRKRLEGGFAERPRW